MLCRKAHSWNNAPMGVRYPVYLEWLWGVLSDIKWGKFWRAEKLHFAVQSMGVSLILPKAGVWGAYQYWSVACWEPGHIAGGEQKASSELIPSLALLSEPCPPALLTLPTEPSSSSPPPVFEEIVVHETDPWCQKGWRPLAHRLKEKDQKAHKFNCQEDRFFMVVPWRVLR